MKETTHSPPEDLVQALQLDQGPHRRPGRAVWLALAAVALAAIAYLAWRPAAMAPGPGYLTEPARRGALRVTVSATGTLEPTNEVEVGSELSGTVQAVLVDVNDRVTRGQLLARLDLAKLEDAVEKSAASLVVAEAKVQQMQATVAEARASLARLRQVAKLSGGKLPSRAELDTAEATLLRAQADAAGAQAEVGQARAGLRSDRTNLSKASIRSPIDGVVLSREVEPGQTVAASLSAPVLFKLAEDLTRMELEVAVDEADVGQVAAGQQAVFSVDAWPRRRYSARITRVSYGAETTDEVVSYPTILSVDNADLSLRPGMTATAEIATVTLDDALLVPNAALRFTPPAAPAPEKGGLLQALLPHPPRQAEKSAGREGQAEMQQVWILKEGRLQPVPVQAGFSDGRWTQVNDGALEPGTPVITDLAVSPP